MRTANLLLMLSMSFVTPKIVLSAQPQSKMPKSLGFFNWELNKCPNYIEIANGCWQTNRLKELCNRIDNCDAISKFIKFDEYWTLNFITYTYSFKSSSDGKDGAFKHKFSFLVGNPHELLLWRETTLDGDAGLTDITPFKVGKRMILEFEYFTGGTAGYYEEYFDYMGGSIKPIPQLFVKESQKLIPPGYSIRRVRLDPQTLTGVIFLSSESDPNCCPSKKLELKIRLSDKGFEFVSGVINAN